MGYFKKLFKMGLLIGVLSLMAVYGADRLVENAGANRVYNSTKEIPYNRVGLLLGTGKILANGRVNLYYKYRIKAAVRLFKAGKVGVILVSGDNSTKDYDEPSTIKEDLMRNGVPANKIVLDYAGFRTLDSVVRCKAVFGQSSVTVISQQFHNERAIYIGQWKGIDAIGYNAKDVNVHYGFKTRLRERLARVKMVLDLVFGKKPKFLGEKIEIK